MKTLGQLSIKLSVILLALTFQSPGFAGGTVTTPTEANLRAALAGGGTVMVACDGTITLTQTLVVTNDTQLDASGRTLVLSGAGQVRIFQLQPGVTLWLKNLTLADGWVRGTNGPSASIGPAGDGGPGQGGAVFNDAGTLVAAECTFLRNTAQGGDGGANTFSTGGTGGAGQGGAIYNHDGQLLITNAVFSQNLARGGTGGYASSSVSTGGPSAGGAIYTTGGLVLLQSSLVQSNRSASGHGLRYGTTYMTSGLSSGGAMESAGGQLVLNQCELRGNSSQTEYNNGSRGGALTQTAGSAQTVDCTFGGNTTLGGYGMVIGSPYGLPGGAAQGGALCLLSGTTGLTNCTFSANFSRGGDQTAGNTPGAGSGGALYSLGAVDLLNCTLAGNIAQAGDGGRYGMQGGAYGGGLWVGGGALTLTHATFAGNAVIPGTTNLVAPVALGGNLCVSSGAASLRNTILAATLPQTNASGTLTDLGHNLASDSSCGFTAAGSRNNTDPLLAPLDNCGGPTPTMALLAGSPALDAGDSLALAPTDQRGHARPFGGGPDIGAFESSPPYTVHGSISGRTFTTEAIVTAASSTTTSTNHGQYALGELGAGAWSIAPQHPDYLFVPDSRSLTLGPDQVGVNFKAYRWNALSIDEVTNGVLHAVFAAGNGLTYRLLESSDLSQWSAVATNTVDASRRWELFLPLAPAGKKFYRVAQP